MSDSALLQNDADLEVPLDLPGLRTCIISEFTWTRLRDLQYKVVKLIPGTEGVPHYLAYESIQIK